MGVYRHKNSENWQIAFQHRGRKVSRTSKTTSRKEAERLEKDLRAEIAREADMLGAFGPAVTFNQAMGNYYRIKVALGIPDGEKSPEQIEREIGAYDRLVEAGSLVGLDTPCADVDTSRLIEIRNRLSSAAARTATGKRKASAVNRKTELIYRILNFARDHMSTPLPNRPRMKDVRLAEDDRNRIVDYDEEVSVCGNLEMDLRPPFVFSLETAVRRGDALGLKWSHVRLGDGSGDRHGHVMAHRRAKGRKLYPIPLNARGAAILRLMQGRHPEYVFTRRTVAPDGAAGGSPASAPCWVPIDKSYFYHRFTKACAAAGVEDMMFLDLRRTAGTRFYLATRDYEATRQYLGHSSVEVTKRYIKLALESVTAGTRDMFVARGDRGADLDMLSSSPIMPRRSDRAA